jgi:alkaline phosphatase
MVRVGVLSCGRQSACFALLAFSFSIGCVWPVHAQPGIARNIVLFLGDAGGIPILHAASIMAYDKPNALFIQSLPHIALMDTSASDSWVTDSAAGMTAIVTGQKTNNGVLSQSASAVRGKSDGEKLKTILEYAEERGLATGLISNMPVTDATVAACYSHVNDRSNTAEIFNQLLSPAYGNGPDVIAGYGRQRIISAITPLGMDLQASLKGKGYAYFEMPEQMPDGSDGTQRVAALFDTQDFDMPLVLRRTLDILSRSPKGFFLMVECDMHTDKVKAGLDRTIVMDRLVRETAERLKESDTLIVFTADHSFDLRVRAGRPGEPLVLPAENPHDAQPTARPSIRMDNGHSGEHVLVAARGPGADRIRGYLSNTDLFRIMLAAYGWLPAQSE